MNARTRFCGIQGRRQKAAARPVLPLLFALTGAFSLLLAPSRAAADPPWWPHSVYEVPYLAAQTGKGVAMWFTSPGAVNADRMERETWPDIDPEIAGENLIWLKLNAREHPEFFSYWQVHLVPTLVILDSTLRDRMRFQGFQDPEELKLILGELERGKASQVTSTIGKVYSSVDPVAAWQETVSHPDRGAWFYDDFNSYSVVGSLPAERYDLYIQAETRISDSEGVDGTPALVLDSGSWNSAVVRILLSRNLEDVEQIIGRIRVRARLQAFERFGPTPMTVGSLVVVPKGQKPTSVDAPEHARLMLNSFDNTWVNRQAVSEPFYFDTHDIWLVLWTPAPEASFGVDNLRTDLLPIDDESPRIDPGGHGYKVTPLGTATPTPTPTPEPGSAPTDRYRTRR